MIVLHLDLASDCALYYLAGEHRGLLSLVKVHNDMRNVRIPPLRT